MSEYVGLDWAGNGWIAVRTVATGAETDPSFDAAFHPSILNAWQANRDAETMLVDIPIGLADETRRRCDEAARSILGNGRSSVFYTPVREAVYEDDYEAAGDANEAATGHRISTQAYHICPPIREVDGFLREVEAARGVVREAHPVVCFAAFAGETGLPAKTTDAGLERRRELLAAAIDRRADRTSSPSTSPSQSPSPSREAWTAANVEALERRHIDERPAHARRMRASNRDDLLDAFALAVTALGERASIPLEATEPPTDRYGLPMEIVAPARVAELA